MTAVLPCPDCRGAGTVRGRWCVRCAGEGVLPPPDAAFDKDAYYAAKYGDLWPADQEVPF